MASTVTDLVKSASKAIATHQASIAGAQATAAAIAAQRGATGRPGATQPGRPGAGTPGAR